MAGSGVALECFHRSGRQLHRRYRGSLCRFPRVSRQSRRLCAHSRAQARLVCARLYTHTAGNSRDHACFAAQSQPRCYRWYLYAARLADLLVVRTKSPKAQSLSTHSCFAMIDPLLLFSAYRVIDVINAVCEQLAQCHQNNAASSQASKRLATIELTLSNLSDTPHNGYCY